MGGVGVSGFDEEADADRVKESEVDVVEGDGLLLWGHLVGRKLDGGCGSCGVDFELKNFETVGRACSRRES